MRSNIPYPDERLLIIRPCHVSLCLGVHSAAKTLAALLYRYSQSCGNETKDVEQDATFNIRYKQSDLIRDMIGEITEKTLHDTALPWLQILGYLEVEELPGKNCYILHIGRIFKGLEAYTQDLKNKTHSQLEKFLIEIPELEKILIEVKGLEIFLINKKYFLSQLEKVLIGNRNSSNCKRGRKPRIQAASEDNSSSLEIHRDSIRDSNIEITEPTATNSHQEISLPVSEPGEIVKSSSKSQNPQPSKKQAAKGKRSKKDSVSQKELPKLEEPMLSEKAREVWNVWLNMPWNKEIPPKLTETAAKHCETLSKVNGAITEDIMFKIRNFAKKNDKRDFYEGKKWELGHVVSEYSRWKSSIYESPSTPSTSHLSGTQTQNEKDYIQKLQSISSWDERQIFIKAERERRLAAQAQSQVQV